MNEEVEREPVRLSPDKIRQLTKNAPKFVEKPLEVLESGDIRIYGNRVFGKLLVLSKSESIKFICDKPWACISIGVEKGDWPKINKVQQIDILKLAFYDTEFKRDDVPYFTPEHAQEILDFLDKVWDKVDYIMVHCLAGMSRSPAVAAAIARIKYGQDQFYFDNYMPNQLVYRTILNVAKAPGYERGIK